MYKDLNPKPQDIQSPTDLVNKPKPLSHPSNPPGSASACSIIVNAYLQRLIFYSTLLRAKIKQVRHDFKMTFIQK
jgi:hypothetical protein